jgi:hypothetical protein
LLAVPRDELDGSALFIASDFIDRAHPTLPDPADYAVVPSYKRPEQRVVLRMASTLRMRFNRIRQASRP